MSSDVLLESDLSLRQDLHVDGSIQSGGDLAADTIRASNVIVGDNLVAVKHASASNLSTSNAVSVNSDIDSNLRLRAPYHDMTMYATNHDDSFGNNNVYFEANNVDNIVYSNVRNVIMGEIDTRVYVGGDLSVNRHAASNVHVSGDATFQNVIDGTANKSVHVLTDSAVQISANDQRFYPTAINHADQDDAFKRLYPFSNMHFDKNTNVVIDTSLSVRSSMIASNLSVARLDFEKLGRDVVIRGVNIQGVVPNASNVHANRVASDTDASLYNLSMINPKP